jgi:uncharacterized membrane protein YfcA
MPAFMTIGDLLILFLAAAAAGAVNAIAGGGTLISFPVLLALGMPPIAANITNAVALCPGYLGATLAQRRNLDGQARRLMLFIPAALLGGVGGAFILLQTGERTFMALVPYMLFLASLLLAIQDRVREFVVRRASTGSHHSLLVMGAIIVMLAAVYGGFFSAGMSVILLAAVALTVDDSFTRLNALKQVLAFIVNVAAAVFFVFSGRVLWAVAAVMAVGALAGGVLGGRIAGRLQPSILRWTVVSIGFALASYYWVKG